MISVLGDSGTCDTIPRSLPRFSEHSNAFQSTARIADAGNRAEGLVPAGCHVSQQASTVSRFSRTPWCVLLAAGGLLGFSRPVAAQFGPAPSYGAPSTLTLSTNPLTVTVADLNHDARLDLVVPANAAGTVMVFWGDGLGGFTAGPALGVGAFPEAAAVADLNADTHPDIAVVSFGTSDVSVLLGDGSGGVAGPPRTPLPPR